jgi:prepilin-type N-terminal cleavage/methylation domain-containing protein
MKINHHNIEQDGFTLVELLVTIVILGIALVGVASLFYTIQYTQRQAMYRDAANRAAQRQVEILRNSSYNSLANGQVINFTSDLPARLPGNKSGVVDVSEPSAGVKRVDVTVTYYDSGKKREVSLTSFIGLIGITR